MSRAVILSIVLAFVAAPHASQLCMAWCDRVDHQVAECHDGDATAGVERRAPCANLDFAIATVVREDTRQSSRADQAPTVSATSARADDAALHLSSPPASRGPGVVVPLRSTVRRL